MLFAGTWHALLWVMRWRPPALFFWSAPALLLIGAGVASWQHYDGADPIWRPLPASPPNAAQLYAEGMAVAPIATGAWVLAVALTLCGCLLGIANIVRAGENARWTLKYAFFTGLLASVGLSSALFVGLEALPIAGAGAVVLPLATLRLGRKKDGKRMAAGRGFVAGTFAGAAASLGLALMATGLHERLVSWADGRTLAVPVLPQIGGASFLACIFILAGMVAMLPHAKRVLDARSAAGVLFSVFWLGPVAAAVLPPLQEAAELPQPDPQANHQLVLRKLGIDLVMQDGAPWKPMPAMIVSPYWAYWGDERIVPFKAGRVPANKLLDDVAVDALDKLTPITNGTVGFEVDEAVDFMRLRPLLRAAQAAELHRIFFVTRTDTGALRLVPASVEPAPDGGVHILLTPEKMTWIDGAEAHPTDLAELTGKSFVLHVDDLTVMPRIIEVLAASGEGEVRFWLK